MTPLGSTAATLAAKVRKAAKLLRHPEDQLCDGTRCHYRIPHQPTDHTDDEVAKLFNEATGAAWQVILPPQRTPTDLLLYPDGSIAYFTVDPDDTTRIHAGTITNAVEKQAAKRFIEQAEIADQGSRLIRRNLTRWRVSRTSQDS